MKTLLSLSLLLAFLLVFFGAQALATGPDDIEAARDMAAAHEDAIAAAKAEQREFLRIKAHTERMAWLRCKEIHGDYAQVLAIKGTGDYVCRPLVGVL